MQLMIEPHFMALIILACCVFLFLTNWISQEATGFLGCLLMVLTGVAEFEEVFSGFSNSIVLLMASAMVVGIAMFQTGMAQLLGRIAIYFSKGSEKIFLLVSCTLTGLLSMFLANTALIASFIPIIDSVCKASSTMKRRDYVLPIALSAMFGGASTLIGTTPQLTANALLMEMTSEEMTMWDLTGPGLLLFFGYLVFLYFYGFRDGQKIWSDREEIPLCVDCDLEQEEFVPSKRKMILMSLIIVFMMISYIFTLLPTAITAMIAAILCVITGLCSTEDIAEKLHWQSVIFLATCLGLGNALTISGAGELVGNALLTALGNETNPWIIFLSFIIITLLISQFITNSTAIIISLPIALSLCEVYGFNVMTFTIGITLVASYAALTPLAASQIAMTEVAGYEFIDYFKYGWKMTLLVILGILLLVPMFFPF